MNYLLPSLILVPLAASVVILLLGNNRGKAMVPVGVVASIITLLLSIALVFQVHNAPAAEGSGTIAPKVLFEPQALSIALPISVAKQPVRWQLILGADGISALLVLLTGIIGCFTIVLATKQIETRTSQYIALMLASISMLMGVFVSMDLVSFYVFFEAVLIPLILLINGWGNGENPLSASRKFLLFTLAGSIPMVIGLIALAMAPAASGQPSTISFMELSKLAAETPIHGSNWVVWLLLLGFGIKLAILPLHTWLPTTYAAAHPNTTSLIASVVAKLGLYGIIRIVIPLTSHSLITEAQLLIGALGAIAIVYGALVALSKSNLREVLAYSSLSHVGFITLGLMLMLLSLTLSALSSVSPTITVTWSLSSKTGIFLVLGPTAPGAATVPKALSPAKLPNPPIATEMTLSVADGAAVTALMDVLEAPVRVTPPGAKSDWYLTKSRPESMYFDNEYFCNEIARAPDVWSFADKTIVMSSPMIKPLPAAMSSTSRRVMPCLGLAISCPNSKPVFPTAPEIGVALPKAVLMVCSEALSLPRIFL